MFHCTFCKAKNASDLFYLTHTLRDDQGNTSCPVLLSNVCDYCQERGHTRKYCPAYNMSNMSLNGRKHELDIASECEIAMHEFIEDNVHLHGDELMSGVIEASAQKYMGYFASKNYSCEHCFKLNPHGVMHLTHPYYVCNHVSFQRFNAGFKSTAENCELIVEFEDEVEMMQS